jgi:hypothetical protein
VHATSGPGGRRQEVNGNVAALGRAQQGRF